ncbi:Membrane associated serine protease, rhomboid family [Actinobaculum suis]|nr:Membrane associated serine protease, rhomboid family [Actinobaculum suis]VDG75393.1 Rhomboid protease [Actinobaculum suis]
MQETVRRKTWRPWLTITLIAANVLVYVMEMVWSNASQALLFAPGIAQIEPYRFLSSAFTHSGFWHLVLNMYALWLVGMWLERMIGRWRFACIYLLSAIAGNIFVLLVATPGEMSWWTGVVGASGAVFGLFGALFVAQRSFGRRDTQLVVVIAINLIVGFIPGMNISWQSHVGGLIAGAVLMAATLRPLKRGRRASAIRDIAVYLLVLGIYAALIWYGYR